MLDFFTLLFGMAMAAVFVVVAVGFGYHMGRGSCDELDEEDDWYEDEWEIVEEDDDEKESSGG